MSRTTVSRPRHDRLDQDKMMDYDVRGDLYNSGHRQTAHVIDSSKRAVTKLPYYFEKRVLITGSSSGIGRSLAFWFLNQGARVALVGRDRDALTEIGAQYPSQAIVIHCDLSEDKQQWEMVTGVIEKFGGLDILINCAGVIFEGDVENTFPQDFDYMMDLNVRLPFHLTNLFFPYLEKSKGCIVNVGCMMGHIPQQGMISYCMSKAGLEQLTKCAALEYAPFGIRVNAVAPSFVETNLYRYSGLNDWEFRGLRERAAENNPLKRLAMPEEVAKAIVFLTSDRAETMTGHVLTLTGGRHLTSVGYKDWYGSERMDRRFEPTSSGLRKTWLELKEKVTRWKPRGAVGSDAWCQWKQRSNWATHMDEAHEKQKLDYQAYNDRTDELVEAADQARFGGMMNPMGARAGGTAAAGGEQHIFNP